MHEEEKHITKSEALLKCQSVDERLSFLKEHKDALIAEKKDTIKYSDVLISHAPVLESNKAESSNQNPGTVTVKVVANSTNVLDSHMDVHVPGNYDQSISSKEGWNHLKDHERKSDSNIGIVKNIEATEVKFRDLGIDKDGTTQCLVYESEVLEALNKGIFYRYKAGLINQHSIGMKYRELELALNDKESPKEKAVWDQFIGKIANPTKAEEAGFFWVVKNIELIECSAVMQGSNQATPTLEVKASPEDLANILGRKEKKEKGMEEIQAALKAQATYIIANANRNKRLRTKI